MKMFKEPIVVNLLVLITGLCISCIVTAENRKNNYIVHVDKSKMPESYEHHSVWYESSLKSISDSAEILYTYDNAMHGFSATLTHEEAQFLKSQPWILGVSPSKISKLQTTRTPKFLGIDKIIHKLPNLIANSSDLVIGIIDSGVWPESKSFDDTGLGPIPSTWKGECETGPNFTTSNCNKKLIGARIFTKGFESWHGKIDETKEIKSARDTDGHGTHTASTATGSVVKGANLFGYASGTAHGMAPHARVAIYKVCWEDSCDSSDILAAIDKAISDNVNILSLSLGTIALNYNEDMTAIGCFAAMEKGISVFAAGGNDGPKYSSVTNVAPWITTVGAGTLDREFPAYVTTGKRKKYLGASLYQGHPLSNTPLPFVYAGNVSNGKDGNLCMPGSLVPKKVKGKVVLCDRGSNARVEKGFVVKSAGGLGMVEANAVKNGEELVADPHFLPALEVGAQSGNALRKYVSSDPNATVKFRFIGTMYGMKPSPIVAAFSSRGPNSITPQILKPDIIGPGVNILAAWSRASNPTNIDKDTRRVDFNIISGTSMACPHLSGIATLVKSAHPKWSPAMIRSALMTTSYTTYSNSNPLLDSFSGKPATSLDFGAGHVNPINALNPGLVYDLNANDYLNFLCALNYTPNQLKMVARREFQCNSRKRYSITDLNYPSFVVMFNGSNIVKHTRSLTNVGVVGTYKASIVVDNPIIKISIEPEELSFGKNEKKSYVVTFKTLDKNSHSDYDFGRLQWSNGKNIVRSPILFKWT
ncbi:hypothetical protein TanjilG_00991 [Lupinus angustifolius]|uniref:Subtilisin-like protease n=1 Tax=Lupinus angustifolius TaxID=3871 RepID=A0A4P1QR15_LUPAN|nr:PREDICTED: subtilisin-like protease SBT1.7 [Lupinus angustifolius]OIV92857.1 hypothetical protein TanjilG_00991 [Lupinus angustifolius]